MTTQIQEYHPTEAALADLAVRFKNVLYDVKQKEGMRDAVVARAELRDYRVGLEKLRKQIKAPALERCQLIDTEARRITSALAALEDPIDAQIKTEEKRKDDERLAAVRAEEERLAAEERARRAAEEEKLAADHAEIERQRAELAEATRAREEADRQARLKIEEEGRVARQRIEEEERAARAAREEADRAARQVREAEEARLKAERDALDADRRKVEAEARAKQEAEDARTRELQRQADELLDARSMLATFRKRFGHRREFAAVVKAIDALK